MKDSVSTPPVVGTVDENIKLGGIVADTVPTTVNVGTIPISYFLDAVYKFS